MARNYKSKNKEDSGSLPPRKYPKREEEAGLEPIPESGKPPKTRVSSAKAARALFEKLVEDDETSAHNRALVRDVLEGGPPYDEGDRMDAGLDGLFNLNFHDMRALLESAKTSYLDLVDADQPLIRVKFPEAVDEAGQAAQWAEKQDIIAEEFSQMVREWESFDSVFELLVTYLVRDGVDLCIHPDEKTWKFEVQSLDDFYVPRRCKVGEDNIPVLFFRKSYAIHELYHKVRTIAGDALEGDRAGRWNLKAVRKALVDASKGGTTRIRNYDRHWADLQDDLSTNDVGTSYESEEVRTVHMMVREVDGSLSHYVFCEDGGGEEFLFEARKRYNSPFDCFTLFTSNIGNGKLHSVRGQLYLAYPFVQTINRLRCATLDSTSISMSVLLQPGEEEAMEDSGLVLNGPATWLPPEAQAVQHRAFPNLSQNALPVLRDLTLAMQNNLGMYQMRGVTPEGLERTRYEVQAQQEVASSLTVSQINRFYRDLKKLWNSSFRRVLAMGVEAAATESDRVFSDYPEVARFYERCAMRGVSPEEIFRVETVVPNKAAGMGSAQARQLAYSEAMQMAPMLDPVGRNRLLFDRFAARFGRDLALSYVGRPEKPRFILDQRLAELENAALRNDPSIEPVSGENAVIHAQVHLAKVGQVNEALLQIVQSGQEPPDFDAVLKEADYVGVLLRHTSFHMQVAGDDPATQAEFRELVRLFQTGQGQWEAIGRYFEKLQPTEQQQKEAVTRMQLKMQESQVKMQIMIEEAALKRQLAQAEVGQKMAIRKAESEMTVLDRLNEQLAQVRAGQVSNEAGV